MTISRIALIGFAAMAVGACTERGEDPPDGAFRFVHAAPEYGTGNFLLEERSQGTLVYSGSTVSQTLDSGPFDFNVELPANGADGLARLATAAIDIEAERLHTLVLFDDGGQLSIAEYVRDFPTVSAGSGDLQLLHAARGAPAVDLYVEADGTDLSAATPRSTLSFRQIADPFELTAGDYRLTLTGVGDPAAVVFESTLFSIADGGSYLINVFATFGLSAADLRATLQERGSTQAAVLNDDRVAPVLQVVNGSAGAGSLDVVIDGDFANPIHAAVAPGTITDFAPTTAGSRQFQVTPAGNMGVIEADVTQTLAPGGIYALVSSGTAGDIDAPIFVADNRGIRSRTRYRLRHAAANAEVVSFYLTEPGVGIVDQLPTVTALQQGTGEFASTILPGDYDLVFVENDLDSSTEDTTIVAGPVPVTFEAQRVYEVYLLDGAVAGEVLVSVEDVTGLP